MGRAASCRRSQRNAHQGHRSHRLGQATAANEAGCKDRQGIRLHPEADTITDDIECRRNGECARRSDRAGRNRRDRPGLQHHSLASRR